MGGLRWLRPSPATVIASIALLVALSGTSVAAVQLIGSAQLKTGAVNSRVIQNGQVRSVDLASGVVRRGPPGPAGPAGPAGAAGAAGPAGPSDAFSRFLNGPLAVPNSPTTLTSLSIPAAGKYVAWGKAYFQNSGVAAAGTVTCRLMAGDDFDEAQTYVQTGLPWTLSTNVVHEFTAAGTIDFKCAYAGSGTTAANYMKITAIKVGNLTNSG